MSLIKHSQRANVKCRRCGRRDFAWYHDTDKAGDKTCRAADRSDTCKAEWGEVTKYGVSYVLMERDSMGELRVHRCGPSAATVEEHETEIETETETVSQSDIRPVSAPVSQSASSETQLLQTLRDLLGATVSPDQVREVVDQAMANQLGSMVGALTGTIDAKIRELEDSRQPVRVELFDKATGQTRELPDAVHQVFPTVLKAVQSKVNTWLTGPAGTGKTKIAHQCAEAMGVNFASVSLTVTMPVSELVGYRDAMGVYQDTAFRRIYEHGGVFLFDECDNGNANTLGKVNEAIANGSMEFPDKRVDRHPDCYIIAAANTFGTGADRQYVGRMQLDAAFLDRFQAKIVVDVDKALETQIAKAHCQDFPLVSEWIGQVRQWRTRADELGMKVVISPRASIEGAKLLAAGFTVEEVGRMTVLNGLSAADQSRLGA